MEKNTNIPQNIDEYISDFPEDVQKLLQKIRAVIQAAAPEATEKMSYAIPTFYLNGNLVHFAAYKNHIGFYPGASGIKAFQDEISTYKNAKGSVQFPIKEEIPFDLIQRITTYRIAENLSKTKKK